MRPAVPMTGVIPAAGRVLAAGKPNGATPGPNRTATTRADRERLRRVRDRRVQLVVVAGAVVVGLVAALSTSPRLLFPHSAPTSRPVVGEPKITMQTVLWAHRSPQGVVDLAALFGLDRTHRTANVMFIPTATVAEVPALDIQAISKVMNLATPAALTTVVANALGVRIDRTAVVTDASVAAMFAITPQISVELLNAVSVEEGLVSLSAGRQRIGASVAARALLGSESEGPLAHFPTMQSIWQGWFTALRSEPDKARKVRGIRNGDVFAALAVDVDVVRFDTLPVTNVAAGESERFEIRDSELGELVHEQFGPAQLGVGGVRPRVELLNGVGTPGLVQQAADLVVPAGGEVKLSGNTARFGETTTRVVYYRDRDREAAEHLARVLGAGQVARGATALTVVDITIVIGRDFLHARPSTTPT